ncbi:MAG: nucleoside 2-deoxyribosyltransferase [Ancylobacter novellus]|uniref:Nucleoside 2-deoxyribosyltransferase n=1 Tax=Ancylobacter novellus TaxID=921 RepID=A0A2W5KFY1_ANCNO|nr:MAG: nucleoside 2-deoxyribosyltransferase [Ancylobacter novellus]
MKAYLAGPEVFRADAREAAAARKALCATYGVEGLHPFDQTLDGLAPDVLAGAIFRNNVDMMRAADVVIADLTPFRSPSADPGTAFELGFAFALGLAVYGWSASPEPLFERTVAGARRDELRGLEDGRTLHHDGLVVEDFGHADNLMLIEAIAASGGRFFTAGDGPWSAPGGLDPFEACLAAASGRLSFAAAAEPPIQKKRAGTSHG